MTITLAIAVLLLVGFVVYRDLLWEQRVSKLELQRAKERQAAADERRELCQRIQAPELATTEHVRATRPAGRKVKPIAADDDAAYLAREEARRG